MSSFLSELRRRSVFKVAVTYGVIAWILVQVADVTFPALQLPPWSPTLVTVLVILGFPIALVMAWAFDLTPAGIKRDGARARAALPRATSALASVAVLPFKSLTPSSPYAFVADGIAMELHNSLARVREIRLAAHRSAVAYAASDRDESGITRSLDVQYVISGSCAHVGDRIQIMAQLDDAANETMLWSQSYEVGTDDVLAVQRRIAEAIVSAFGGERLRAEVERTRAIAPKNLTAWEHVQRARAYLLDYTPAAVAQAVPLLEKAVKLAPDYAAAHAMLGLVRAEMTLNGISRDAAADRKTALAAVERAEALAPQDPLVLRAAGPAHAYCGDYRRSAELLRRAVALAPYDLGAWGYFGWPLAASGDAADLRELHGILDRLLDTAPKHPGRPYWLYHKSVAYSCEDRCEDALEAVRQATAEQPRFALAWMDCANVLGRLSRPEAARAAAERCTSINPSMTTGYYVQLMSVLSDDADVVKSRTAGLEPLAAGLSP